MKIAFFQKFPILYLMFFVLNNIFKKKIQQNFYFNWFYNCHKDIEFVKDENTKTLHNLIQNLTQCCRFSIAQKHQNQTLRNLRSITYKCLVKMILNEKALFARFN